MPHYNSYDSFRKKKSREKKERAKNKGVKLAQDFIVDCALKYGVVVEVRYYDIDVYYNGEIVLAHLRKDLNRVCNQILFSGDKVVLQFLNNHYIITNLIRRTSLLSRIKKDSTRLDDVGKVRPVAANVDVALIVVAAHEPPLHPKFIDRYLMVLQNSQIPVVIVLNKCDLKTILEDRKLEVYKKLGIPVIETSTYTLNGIESFKKMLRGKQAILVGNSGVGKSSLINAIMGMKEIKTGHVSEKSKKGRHTTTISKYYVWEDGSSIIDTPGIRSLDVSNFRAIKIQDYFKEFQKFRCECKYADCLHYHEKIQNCRIKQEVMKESISKERYESYLRIMSELLKSDKSKDILKEMETYYEDKC